VRVSGAAEASRVASAGSPTGAADPFGLHASGSVARKPHPDSTLAGVEMTKDKSAKVKVDVEEEEDDIDDDSELSRKDIERLHEALLAKRAEVKAKLDKHLQAVVEDSDNLPDEMDIATRQSEQAYFLRIADKEKKLLAQIDHALAKFERGTFGVCEGTGDPIGLKRLELRPWTRYSLDHKERLEREKKGGRRR